MVGEEVGPCSSVLHEILLITSFFRRQHVVLTNLENTWEHEMFRRCRNSSVVTSPRLRLTRPTHGSSPQAVSTRTTFDTSWREMISDLVLVSFIASPGQVPHRVTESVRALGTELGAWEKWFLSGETAFWDVLSNGQLCSVLACCAMLCHVVWPLIWDVGPLNDQISHCIHCDVHNPSQSILPTSKSHRRHSKRRRVWAFWTSYAPLLTKVSATVRGTYVWAAQGWLKNNRLLNFGADALCRIAKRVETLSPVYSFALFFNFCLDQMVRHQGDLLRYMHELHEFDIVAYVGPFLEVWRTLLFGFSFVLPSWSCFSTLDGAQVIQSDATSGELTAALGHSCKWLHYVGRVREAYVAKPYETTFRGDQWGFVWLTFEANLLVFVTLWLTSSNPQTLSQCRLWFSVGIPSNQTQCLRWPWKQWTNLWLGWNLRVKCSFCLLDCHGLSAIWMQIVMVVRFTKHENRRTWVQGTSGHL